MRMMFRKLSVWLTDGVLFAITLVAPASATFLYVDPGEFLVTMAADSGGETEGEHAEFSRRTGRVGGAGAGTRLAASLCADVDLYITSVEV